MTISTRTRVISAIGAASLCLTALAIAVAPNASAATCSLIEGTDFTDNTSLQSAITGASGIACASDGDVITVTFSSDATRGSVFAITSMINYSGPADLTLAGNPTATTTLDGSNSSAIIYTSGGSATVTINNLTLTHASSTRGVGEIAGDLIATHVIMSNNTSTGYGLRVHGNNGARAASLTYVTADSNTAANGGGVLYADLGNVEVTNSTLTNNTVTGSGKKGGAISIYAGDAVIMSSVFSGNGLSGGGAGAGGAVYLNGANATATITGSQFTGNTTSGTGAGGAVRASGGSSTVSISNSTFTSNIAAGSAGAVGAATVNVTFSTFSENDAQAAGQISGQIGATTINATGNIFSSTTGESCVSTTRNTDYNIASTGDGFCAPGPTDLTAAITDLALAALAPYGSSGTSALVPAGTSLAIGLVPSSVAAALTPAVTTDQGDAARNGAWYTAGAVQVDCPDDPTAVTGTPRALSADINFTAPVYTGGSAITNYEYSLDGGAWTAANPTATTSPLTITGLTAGQPYLIRIRAINATSHGAATAAVSVTPTAAGQLPTVVRNLRVTSSDPSRGKATIAWAAPSNAGAYPVITYTVRVRMAPDTDYVTAKRTSALSTTLTSLVRGRMYYVRVRATNATGNGPAALLKVKI